jgi:hypothetical protein
MKRITILTLVASCLFSWYLLQFAKNINIENILVGILSSSITILILEIVLRIQDYEKYSYLRGNYKRIKFENGLDERNKETDRKYEDITNRYLNINPLTELKYRGDGKYEGEIEYEEGNTIFTIEINLKNTRTGNGTYFYKDKKPKYIQNMPDHGTYQIFVENIKGKIMLYVYHENYVPSGLAWGYEIWEKS